MKFKAHNLKRFVLLLVLTACSIPAALIAQVTGSISGYIHDPSGAVLVNVKVTAVSAEEHTTRSVQTDDTGFFNMLSMPRGHYSITAIAEGLTSQTQNNVELTSGGAARVDFALTIGTVTQSVTVDATVPLIETTVATQSTLIDDRRVQDLPLNGRNVIGLANTLSEAVGVTATQTMGDARSGPTLSVSGANQNGNYFTLNGATYMNFDQTTGYNPPPPDAVQEIRIQTHDFPAEYGFTAGSQTSMVTKSGTNQIHGTAWEFFRGNALNAKNYFPARDPITHRILSPHQVQHQTGASIGGPLWKDKLFYFGSYQRLSQRQSSESSAFLVPSEAERAGNFSELSIALKNPSDPVTGKPLTTSSGQPCVQNNVIAPGCMSPAAQKVLQTYVPQSGGATSASVTTFAPNPFNNTNLFVRGDYNISPSDLLFVHFTRDHTDTSNLQANVNYVMQSIYTNIYQAAIHETHTFTGNLINEGIFAYTVNKAEGGSTSTVDPTSFGSNVPLDPNNRGLTIQVSGGPQLNYPGMTNQYYNQFELSDSVSWIHGRHTLKFGYQGLSLSFKFKLPLTRQITYTGSQTNNSLADFVLGRFDQGTFNYGSSDNSPRGWKQAIYFEDSFKMNPRFVLNYGLRWEPFQAFVQSTGTILSWQPGVQSVSHPDAPTGILFGGDNGLPQGSLVYSRWNQFAPRLGVVWDVSGNAKTVVRAAAGTFFQSGGGDMTHSAMAPWEGTSNLYGGTLDDPWGSLNQPQPPTSPTLSGNFGCSNIATAPGLKCDFRLPITMAYTDPHFRAPTYQHFSLGVQRQLSEDWTTEIAYTGLVGYNMAGHNNFNAARPINDPFNGAPPSAQNINDRVTYLPGILGAANRVLGNFYHMDYHALNVKLRSRTVHGFSLQAGYTLSKNMTNLTDIGVGLVSNVANPFNLSDNRGPSLLDHRHVVAISEIWSPEVHFSNGFLQNAVSGWTFTGLHRYQTGSPSNILMGSDVAVNGSTYASTGQIAKFVPGASNASVIVNHPDRASMVSNYFNVAAFYNNTSKNPALTISALPRGTYGNARRGTIYGPNLFNTDFAVMKNIPLGTERIKAQFRGEFFNLFNDVHFNNPDTNASSGTFGRLTSAQPGRVIQLAVKLIW